MLNEYGKAVRKARIEIGTSMLKMADSLGVAPSFLSQLETGKRKISDDFVSRVENYFKSFGLNISLKEKADVSNGQVSLEGVDPKVKHLIAGFARAELSDEDIRRLTEILSNSKKPEGDDGAEQ